MLNTVSSQQCCMVPRLCATYFLKQIAKGQLPGQFNFASANHNVVDSILLFALETVFNWGPKGIRVNFFALLRSVIGCHFLNQSEAKLNQLWLARTRFSWCSRAWRRLHEFASTSDWLIVVFASVVIGQSALFCLFVCLFVFFLLVFSNVVCHSKWYCSL